MFLEVTARPHEQSSRVSIEVWREAIAVNIHFTRENHRLSTWATVGGATLAFNAGFINSTGVMGFAHKAVSHMTGTVTLNAIAVSQFSEVLETGVLMGSFFVGAVVSGAIIGGMSLKFGRRYGVALLLESVILFLAWILFNHQSLGGEFLAAMACGLQNAMVSSMSGSIVRTTHLTGIVTDLGNILGNLLCHRRVEDKHPLLLLSLFLAFYAGAIAGTLSYTYFGMLNILFSCCFTAFLGTTYLILRILYGKSLKKASEIHGSC